MVLTDLVEPIPRETFFSFLGRFAAENGRSATNFCIDRGVSAKRALGLEPRAVQRGGLSHDQLAEMLSWTGEHAGEVRTLLRGEVFVSRAVRNPVVRGCPVCLREDAEADPETPTKVMAMRGDWQLREASLCVKHGHALVPLWDETLVIRRHDAKARLAAIQAAVLSGRLDCPREPPSPYDLWLDRRLEDGRDPTWLSGHSHSAATTLCRLSGMELLRIGAGVPLGVLEAGAAADDGTEVDGEEAPRVLRTTQAAGFDVLRRGAGALRTILDAPAATVPRAKAEPRKAFGRLFFNLDTLHRADADFDPVRRILRDCILDTWPIAAGEEVLGETLPARRLHSLGSAALETGVGLDVLARHLVAAGVIPSDGTALDKRWTFDARTHAEVLARIATLIDSKAMSEAMGATAGELASLEADGVLRPWSQDASLKARWQASDGLALVAELREQANPVAVDASGWERLQKARARTRLGLDRLIDATRTGGLVLGRIEGDTAGRRRGAYHDLVVQRDAVDALARTPRSKVEAPSPPGALSAAEFGATVGLWNHGQVAALAEAGHVPSVLARFPATGSLQRRMSEEDVAAFHRRFVTIRTIIRETALHRNTIRARLAAGRVEPFTADGLRFGLVYLRAKAQVAIAALRGASRR